MIWLVISILISSFLYVIFKLFERFKVVTLQAIVVNYLVAGTTGLLMTDIPFQPQKIITEDWFPIVLLMGFLFISVFNIMALTAQRNGLSVASVAGKMSVVIPVVYGLVEYQESTGFVKILGIFLALLAVFFTTTGKDNRTTDLFNWRHLILPGLLFVGSGVIDIFMKVLEKNHMEPSMEPIVSACIFFTALTLGIVAIAIDYFKNGTTFQFKSIIAGIALGIPNYFSIVVFFKALGSHSEASFIYPINHVGIVIVSTLFGLFIFKEKLKARNWFGILLAVVAISCIAFAKA